MIRFCSVFLDYVLTSPIKFLGFLSRYVVYRSKPGSGEENGSNFSANHSQEGDQFVSKNSTVFLSSGLSGKGDLGWKENRGDSDGKISGTEEVGSVLMKSDLIGKYQFISGKDVCGYFQEPKTEKFVVQEMFVGSGESSDQSLDSENFEREEDSLGKPLQEFDERSDTSSLCFKLFDASCFANEDDPFRVLCREEGCRESGKISYVDFEEFEVEMGRMDLVEDEILEEKNVSYAVELLSEGEFAAPDANQELGSPGDNASILAGKPESVDEALCDSENWMGSFLEESHQIRAGEDHEAESGIDHTQQVDDLDDEFIVIEPQSSSLTSIGVEGISCEDANRVEEPHEQPTMPAGEAPAHDSRQEQKNSWESSNGDDDDEPDVLWEHQHLVQQMKMELKSCRIGGLPTISEECETPKIVEDLKPLHIDQKIEYKDVMEEIKKFYKSYVEKMRKLDILNYQTLHTISFLQLKVSEVITAGNRKADLVPPFVLPKMRPYKVQRIYADPMHKSIVEMHRNLELVYVGQVCLSWEILCWLYAKAQQLLGYDSEGSHSYNRAADEFQQFQVLVQRFVEDESFQGQRIQNYVKSRCMMLQVPTISDDCLKTKKVQTMDTDAISLKMLIQTIRESMLIFRDFLFADKRSTNAVLKGNQETNLDVPRSPANSQLLINIITNLHKKERKIREHIRSQNCIVKKLKRHHHHHNNHQELQPDNDDNTVLTSQVELRIVSRVLSMSRLTTDQLIWCQNKLKNINFVRRKVHLEPSFLLFPC